MFASGHLQLTTHELCSEKPIQMLLAVTILMQTSSVERLQSLSVATLPHKGVWQGLSTAFGKWSGKRGSWSLWWLLMKWPCHQPEGAIPCHLISSEQYQAALYWAGETNPGRIWEGCILGRIWGLQVPIVFYLSFYVYLWLTASSTTRVSAPV